MKSFNKIGIMQGRLSLPINRKIQSFPQNSWKDEFASASSCGFEVIEWIFDIFEKNPIMQNDGIYEIKEISDKTGISINSILADYFMEKKLVNVSEFELEQNLNILVKLLENTSKLNVNMLEIPLVDSSSLKTKDEQFQLTKNLEKILPLLDEYDIFLNFETDLPPKPFKQFIESFNHYRIRANYDVGNSAALGYDVKEELSILGNFIQNIHIKDRKYHGNTVSLGFGDVDFDTFFEQIQKINYKGDFIIQGARNSDEPPNLTCEKYLKFVKNYVEKY